MNIRKKTEIAIPIIVLLTFATFLLPFLVGLLPIQIKNFYFIKLIQLKSISNFHTLIIRISFWTTFVLGLLDSIVNKKKWFKALSSQYAMFFVIVSTLLIGAFTMNPYWLLLCFYVVSYIGLLLSFNQIIANNGFDKGMFKYVKQLKNGIGKSNNYVDTVVVFIASIISELLLFAELISFIFLVALNYRQLF